MTGKPRKKTIFNDNADTLRACRTKWIRHTLRSHEFLLSRKRGEYDPKRSIKEVT
jgi:hypothetical protein